MKHIQEETRCRIQIKDRGSGFIEHGNGRERMRICISMWRKYIENAQGYILTYDSGPDPNKVQKAKELYEDLLKNVREQY